MINYKELVSRYCLENDFTISLSFDMPSGYEDANAMYDDEKKSIFINLKVTGELKEYEQYFYLYHELRHASQYNKPNEYDISLVKSMDYVIMFNGICYKVIDGKYIMTHIDGNEDFLLNAYLSQPYELDANRYAYEVTKRKYGNIKELDELLNMYMPKRILSNKELSHIYKMIDINIESL